MQLTKIFASTNVHTGKCQSIEVTVDYDPKREEAKLIKVFALECSAGVKDGTRWEDVPHAMIDVTQVFEDYLPDQLDKWEKKYDWSLVYAEHEDLTYKEIAA